MICLFRYSNVGMVVRNNYPFSLLKNDCSGKPCITVSEFYPSIFQSYFRLQTAVPSLYDHSCLLDINSQRHKKPVFRISDQVGIKPGYSAITTNFRVNILRNFGGEKSVFIACKEKHKAKDCIYETLCP